MRVKSALLLAGVMMLVATWASADMPGKHPYYLHALSDLRAARWMIQNRAGDAAVSANEGVAIAEINKAIGAIKHAAIDDGKNPNDHPPIDVRLSWHDRFARANELLARAHHDLDQAEDVPEARGLRDRAILHIDEAHNTVDRAWRTAHWQ